MDHRTPPAGMVSFEAAARAAKASTNAVLWFFFGFILGPIGVLFAYVLNPSVASPDLANMPAGQVAAYTGAYQRAGRTVQGRLALVGCGTAIVVGSLFGLALATYPG